MDKREFIKAAGLVVAAGLVGIMPSTVRAQSAREIAAVVIRSTRFNGRITVFDGRDERRYGVRFSANGKTYNRTMRVRKVDTAKLGAMLEGGELQVSIRAGNLRKSGTITARLRGDELSGTFGSDDNQGEYQTQLLIADDLAVVAIVAIVAIAAVAITAIVAVVAIETQGDVSAEISGGGGSASVDLEGGGEEGDGGEGENRP